jgi:hypothetical protein
LGEDPILLLPESGKTLFNFVFTKSFACFPSLSMQMWTNISPTSKCERESSMVDRVKNCQSLFTKKRKKKKE